MEEQTIAVSNHMDAVSAPVEAEQTASVVADAEQTTQSDSDISSEEKSNTGELEGAGTVDSDGKTVPYSRFSEVYDRMKAAEEKARLYEQGTQNNTYTTPGDPQEDQVKSALQKVGVPFTSEVQKMIKDAIAEDRVYREMDQAVQKLSKEWDGRDGKPSFNIEEVAEYAQRTGIYDPEAAFKQMYAQPIAEYYAKQAKTNVKTERQSKPVQDVGADYNALKKEAAESGDFSKLIMRKFGA